MINFLFGVSVGIVAVFAAGIVLILHDRKKTLRDNYGEDK